MVICTEGMTVNVYVGECIHAQVQVCIVHLQRHRHTDQQ